MRHFNPLFILLAASFASCTQNKNPSVTMEGFRLRGDTIVAQTFDTLRNTLLKAIGERGLPMAVEFCNINALPLTNAFSAADISIKRTSDKIRNPANSADTMEQRILATYLQLKNNKGALKPIVEKDAAGNHHYYKPIIVQAMCLNCHGDKNTQIQPGTWQAIKAKYPGDAAFDYEEGDFRGIWHVKFSAEKQQKGMKRAVLH